MAQNSESEPVEQQKIIELKKGLLSKYFIEAQKEYDEQFVNIIFQLADHDQQIDSLIQQNILKILNSRQKSAISFLLRLLSHSKYSKIAQSFLISVIQLKTTIYNQYLLLYVLKQMQNLLKFVNNNSYGFIQSLITFLAMKMRSFNLQIRITSLHTLKTLGEYTGKGIGQWDKAMRKIVPTMIEKQQLVKQVSYTKGLFLQMLQDEFHEVRIACIQCLAIFRNYLRLEDLKQIIIYMLNDEHELVRQVALRTAKSLKNLPLYKEDLETLLMCLRQKRTSMRWLVYQNLSNATITDVYLLPLMIQRVTIALQNYRSDKKHIYRALLQMGKQYASQMGKIYPQLGFSDLQQPNIKNIVYKSKMVLLFYWWQSELQNSTIQLPSRFTKHMLYIKDVQSYLFTQECSIMQEQEYSNIDFKQLERNFHHLIRFIESEEEISQQFHKLYLQVVREKALNMTTQSKLQEKVNYLQVIYKLEADEKLLIQNLKQIISKRSVQSKQIVQIVSKCVSNRQFFELKDSIVPLNKCTVSRLEPNLIVSSNEQEFINKVILKCWKHPILGKERKVQFRKLKGLERVNREAQGKFWSVNFGKYNQIKCILMLPNGQERVLDHYDIEQK